jgi:hypothetical protein
MHEKVGKAINFCAIASVLSDEYKVVFKKRIKTIIGYEAVASLIQEREL